MSEDLAAQVVETENVAATSAAAEKASDKEINLRKLVKQNKALEQQNQMVSQELAQMRQMIEMSRTMMPQQAVREISPYEKYGLEPGGLVEADKFITALAKEREDMEKRFEKKAEEAAERLFEKRQNASFGERISMRYPDYDQVINEENMHLLEEEDPEFVESLNDVKDEFKRRELAYKKTKRILNSRAPVSISRPEEPRIPAQTIVDQNKKAAYGYTPTGGGQITSNLDWKSFHSSPSAQKQAYEKLKQMQGPKRG